MRRWEKLQYVFYYFIILSASRCCWRLTVPGDDLHQIQAGSASSLQYSLLHCGFFDMTFASDTDIFLNQTELFDTMCKDGWRPFH